MYSGTKTLVGNWNMINYSAILSEARSCSKSTPNLQFNINESAFLASLAITSKLSENIPESNGRHILQINTCERDKDSFIGAAQETAVRQSRSKFWNAMEADKM